MNSFTANNYLFIKLLRYIIGNEVDTIVFSKNTEPSVFATFQKISGCRHVRYLYTKGGFYNYALSNTAAEAMMRQVGRMRFIDYNDLVMDYTSFNPTGIPHPGNLISAARGEIIFKCVRILCSNVHSVYYLNDIGHQVDLLVRDVQTGRPVTYVDTFNAISSSTHSSSTRSEIVSACLSLIFQKLSEFGIRVNFIVPESLMASRVSEMLKILEAKGFLSILDGKLMMSCGDESVCLISENKWTYFCADLALQHHHYQSGYRKSMILLGGDHTFHIRLLQKAFDQIYPGFLIVVNMGKLSILENGKKLLLGKRKMMDKEKIDLIVKGKIFLYAASSKRRDFNITVEQENRLVRETCLVYLAETKLSLNRLCGVYPNKNIFRLLIDHTSTIIRSIEMRDPNYVYRSLIALSDAINGPGWMPNRIEYLQTLRVFKTNRSILNV